MKEKLNRRNFIKKSGMGIGFASIVGAKDAIKTPERGIDSKMPKRKLGRTGKMVSCLGFGGGSRYLIPDERTAEKLIQYAFNLGITFYDTSLSYGDGKSESRYGNYLVPFHRDEIFLSTKTDALTYDEIMRDIERSLKYLKTDYVDLYSFHYIDNTKDRVRKISSSKGALEGAVKLKDEGIIKAIGFSFHEWGETAKQCIKRINPDVIICPLNAARSYGYAKKIDKADSTEENLLPYAQKNNIGIAAIKTTGQNSLIGNVSGQELVRYTMSLPVVGTVLVGMDGFGTLESCVKIAKEPSLSPTEREAISKKLAYDPEIHKLPYLQPGYVDDGSIHTA